MRKTGLFIYGAPELDADLRHATGFLAPDAFLTLFLDDRKIAVLSCLELDRGRRSGSFDEVLDLAEVRKNGGPKLADQIVWLARKYELEEIAFPEDFPASHYEQVRAAIDLPLRLMERPVRKERIIKTDLEQQAIARVNAVVSDAFSLVERILGEASIRNELLYWQGEPLTSEILQREIGMLCLGQNCFAEGIIAAGGDQACDPHERGYGPLSANSLIIVDIFPRDLASGYHGDMTRTYLKGSPSEEQKRLVQSVLYAHQKALDQVTGGVSGDLVHQTVVDSFDALGYKTGFDEQGYHGFFHGTGHGLGLQVHEAPRVSKDGGDLQSGMVITIEPGLYYRGLGGCRMEDVVCVTADGFKPLSNHPYQWRID